MLILTANPQPKPYTDPLSYCRASECLSARHLLKDAGFIVQKGERESEWKCAREMERKEVRKKQRKCEAARESSNVNFPWTFLGATIKPLVPLKLESKTCDWIVEEDGEA